MCLNPCYTGSYAAGEELTDEIFSKLSQVLILVILEVTLLDSVDQYDRIENTES